ncbi:MAG: IgGFc-binding protein [Kofleriaceae bacterium]
MRLFAAVIAWFVVACGPGGRDHGACDPNTMSCNGNELETCQDGTFQDSEMCPMACSPTLGCVMCVPNTATCNGNVAHECNADGTGYMDETCDPIEGETCDPTAGGCTGPCALKTLGLSYIGCEYYPTITGNIVGNDFDFALAISNTSASVATVTIDGGALTTAMTVMVPPNQLVIQKLPWQQALKMCNGAETSLTTGGCQGVDPVGPGLVVKGGYHLRSDNPITLYQFNSLEYSLPAQSLFSYSNDASLMLPTNVWRSSYFTAAWEGAAGINPSEMAITAMHDGTMVTIKTRGVTAAAAGVPALAVGTPATVMMNSGDVIELTSDGDFTGTQVDATASIQVIGGHYCANVPDGVAACDHMEESMFGVDTLGSNYIVNAPAVTSIPNGKVEVVRIIATQAGTTLTYNPPQAGAPASIANAGDYVQILNTAASFEITASAKVLVAQYMEGQDAGGNTGDPAMALAVPVEQFRTSYLFHAPVTYDSNYVDVTAPSGANIMLDGTAVTLTPIGTTGFSLGRVKSLGTGPANDGSHSITGDLAFGITVYGYGTYTSYWYPGGLNLTSVID